MKRQQWAKYLYLAPYLFIASRRKTKPIFPGVSIEQASRSNGIGWLTLLVSWPFMLGVLLMHLDASQDRRDSKLLAVLPYFVVAIVHFAILDKTRTRRLVANFSALTPEKRKQVMIGSYSLYAIWLIGSALLGRKLYFGHI